MTIKYANNSIKNRTENKETEKKDIKKIVKNGTKKRKKSEISKIATSIISEESKSIKDYAIYEVIVPVIKDTIASLVKGSIDMIFYGEVRNSSSSRGGRNSGTSKVSYNKFYEDGSTSKNRRDTRNPNRYSYDDVLFDTREDASEVLVNMDDIIDQYGVVTVADLFDLSGITGNGYTDQNYGWTSTRSASVERNRDGDYFIKMQRPTNIV